MAITENLRSARLDLFRKERSRKKWIGISKTRHGAWAEARSNGPGRTPNQKTVAHLFADWKAAVAQLHALDAEIQALNTYLERGATTASLDVCKGIAVWEGGRSRDGLFHPYQDPVGVWTIGFGHTNADGAPHVNAQTPPLSLAEATTLLLHDIKVGYADAVSRAFKDRRWKANQKMFDAEVSFAYNLGTGYFAPGHSMGDAMATNNVRLVAHTFLAYDMAGGQVLAGLLHRRQWESQLFLGGTYTVNN